MAFECPKLQIDPPTTKPSRKSPGAIPAIVLAGGIVAVAALSQFLASCGKGSGQERTLLEETLNVDAGTFVARGFDLPKDSTVNLAYEVREGRGVDVFVVTEVQKREFEKAPQKPWSNPPPPLTDTLFGGKAWFYRTRISASDQLSRHQGSLMLPPGRWSIIVRAAYPEPHFSDLGIAKVFVKISVQ